MKKRSLISWVVIFLLIGVSLLSFSGCTLSKSTLKSDTALLTEVRRAITPIASKVQWSSMALWWVSPDGLSIINDNSPAVEARFPGCVNDDSNFSMWRAKARKVIAVVDEVMSANKFKVDNSINSSNSLSDTKFYDYIRGYYRGGTKAVLSISPDCGSTLSTENPEMYYSVSFGYTNEYQRNYERQSPFLHDLNLKDVIVHIQKSDGEFRLLAVNYRRSGHATIVRRIGNKWTELWSGQDLIPCALRDQKKIPLSIAGDCY